MPQIDPSRQPSPEDERKARKAIAILYAAMVILVVLPFVVAFFLRS